jgi:hypothetical protein
MIGSSCETFEVRWAGDMYQFFHNARQLSKRRRTVGTMPRCPAGGLQSLKNLLKTHSKNTGYAVTRREGMVLFHYPGQHDIVG